MLTRVNNQVLVALLVLLGWSGGVAADEELRWKVSPLLGIHGPALSGLNKHEFKSPIPASGALVVDAQSSVNIDMLLANQLPAMSYGALAGVELANSIDGNNDVLLGFGTWESGATAVINATVPFQGVFSDTAFERSGKVSYMEYYLGWKHYLQWRPQRARVYSRIAVHEMFDVDYEERLVFAFSSGPAETFKRIVVMNSQATGIMMGEIGMGFEKGLGEWLSFGMDAGYLFSTKTFSLRDGVLKTDFQDNDNFDITLPARVDGNGDLVYLEGDGVSYSPMKLGFEGWRILFRVNFNY